MIFGRSECAGVNCSTLRAAEGRANRKMTDVGSPDRRGFCKFRRAPSRSAQAVVFWASISGKGAVATNLSGAQSCAESLPRYCGRSVSIAFPGQSGAVGAGKFTMTLSIREPALASCGNERSGERIENASEASPSLRQSSLTSGRRRQPSWCLSNQREKKDGLVPLCVFRRRTVRMAAEIGMRQRTEGPVTMRMGEAAP